MPKENYSKVSSDDTEKEGRSSTFDIERAEESPNKVFTRRPALNQVMFKKLGCFDY